MNALNWYFFSDHLSLASTEILVFGSHSSVNFQLILDCFTPNFKLKYEDSVNIKSDLVNKVVFNLRQIKRREFFFGHPLGLRLLRCSSEPDKLSLSVSLGDKPESESSEDEPRELLLDAMIYLI